MGGEAVEGKKRKKAKVRGKKGANKAAVPVVEELEPQQPEEEQVMSSGDEEVEVQAARVEGRPHIAKDKIVLC
jgi:hypothetical protein